MNLTDIKPYSKFIIIGAIIFLLLILAIVSLLPKSPNPQTSNSTQTPTQTVPPIQNVQLQQPQNFQTDLQKITPVLPYKNENFEIVYQKYPNIINANVFATTPEQYLQNKAAAENYLKSLGITDICSLNIFWNPPLTLIKKLNAQNIITTGCPPSPAR